MAHRMMDGLFAVYAVRSARHQFSDRRNRERNTMTMNHITLPITAVSCVWGGYSRLRHNAMVTALRKIDDTQKYLPSQWIMVEMLARGEEPMVRSALDLPIWMQYIRIRAEYQHRNIFHKEGLWNYGAKMANNDRMVFLDADFYPVDTAEWFSLICDALDEPHVIIHPVGIVEYDGNTGKNGRNIIYESMWMPKNSHPECGKVYSRFPGLGIGIRFEDFYPYKWNTLGISGSGDVIAWHERTNYSYPFFDNRLKDGYLRKNLPKLTAKAIDIRARHCYHGEIKDRAYTWSREIISLMALPDVLTYEDDNGLRCWHDPDCWLADVIMRKNEMTTKEELLSLLKSSAEERMRKFAKL